MRPRTPQNGGRLCGRVRHLRREPERVMGTGTRWGCRQGGPVAWARGGDAPLVPKSLPARHRGKGASLARAPPAASREGGRVRLWRPLSPQTGRHAGGRGRPRWEPQGRWSRARARPVPGRDRVRGLWGEARPGKGLPARPQPPSPLPPAGPRAASPLGQCPPDPDRRSPRGLPWSRGRGGGHSRAPQKGLGTLAPLPAPPPRPPPRALRPWPPRPAVREGPQQRGPFRALRPPAGRVAPAGPQPGGVPGGHGAALRHEVLAAGRPAQGAGEGSAEHR